MGSVAACRYCPIVSACLGLNKGFLGEGPTGWKPIFENSALRELGSNLIFDEILDRAVLISSVAECRYCPIVSIIGHLINDRKGAVGSQLSAVGRHTAVRLL